MLDSRFFSVLFVLIVSLGFCSCGKKGCTDSDATTYNSDAKKDDGTCRYEGSAVFWLRDSTAQEMLDDTLTSLALYIDGNLEDQIQLANQTFTEAPDCGADKAFTIEQDLFDSKITTFSYRILDNNSNIRWAGAFSLNANRCEKFELVYFP